MNRISICFCETEIFDKINVMKVFWLVCINYRHHVHTQNMNKTWIHTQPIARRERDRGKKRRQRKRGQEKPMKYILYKLQNNVFVFQYTSTRIHIFSVCVFPILQWIMKQNINLYQRTTNCIRNNYVYELKWKRKFHAIMYSICLSIEWEIDRTQWIWHLVSFVVASHIVNTKILGLEINQK